MQRIILFALLLISLSGLAQAQTASSIWPNDPSTKRYTFTEVVTAEGTKQELEAKAQKWMARTFPGSQGLTARGSTPIRNKTVNLLYTFQVQVKDGKYQYQVTDLVYEAAGTGRSITAEEQFSGQALKKDGTLRPAYLPYKVETEKLVASLVIYLKDMMATSSEF